MTIHAPDFRIVPEHVARNPVARAIERRRIEDATRAFQIRLYSIAEGEPVHADAQTAAKVVAVAVAILDRRKALESITGRLLRGGLSALAQCSQRDFRWRVTDATAVDMALSHAREVFCKATAEEVRRAFLQIDRLPPDEVLTATAVQQPAPNWPFPAAGTTRDIPYRQDRTCLLNELPDALL